MHRRITLVAVALLAVACGGGGGALGQPTATGPATDPDQPVSSTPTYPGDTSSGEPQMVEPRPGMEKLNAIPFDDVEARDDGRTLTVRYTSGVEPCYVLDSVEVVEHDDEVEITLLQGSDPDEPDAMCIEIAEAKQVEVTLDNPLGDRDIVDGAAR